MTKYLALLLGLILVGCGGSDDLNSDTIPTVKHEFIVGLMTIKYKGLIL